MQCGRCKKLLGILVFIGLLSIFAGNSAATLVNNLIDEYGNGSINGQHIYGYLQKSFSSPFHGNVLP